MLLHPNTRLKDIQEEFQHIFPYLMLTFYDKISKEPCKGEACLQRVRPGLLATEIVFDPSQPTGQFERSLGTLLDIEVQVLRKSYGRWLPTWATDVWTLYEQNRRGSIMGEVGIAIA